MNHFSSTQELHKQVEERLKRRPFAWVSQMSKWTSEESFQQTIASNSQGYYLYLNALVEVLEPSTVVELGTCHGGSAIFILLGLREQAKLVSYDLGQHQPVYLEPFKEDPRLTLLVADSTNIQLYQELGLGSIDLLFIDTDHTNAQATKEWDLYQPLISPRGVVAMDDIHMNDMDLFWDKLPNDKVDTGAKYHGTGFGIFYV